MVTTSDIVGGICMLIAHKIGFRIMTFQSEIKCITVKDADDALIGLMLALKRPVKTSFSSAKTSTPLFSALGMSLRFRSWAEKHGLTAALRPNNFFFANNPGETQKISNKEMPVNYGTKHLIISLFENAAAGSMFYTLFNYCCKILDLSDCPETEDYFCRKNFISFDEMVKIGWIPVYSQKGQKRVLETYKKGAWPSRSPLFTKEEFHILSLCAENFFESLAPIRDSYYEMLLSNGYSFIDKEIRRRFAIRHELLAKFAACSTKRLQELRALKNDQRIKKKDCKPADIKQLLSSRVQPLSSFAEEIKSIFKSEIMPTALSHLAIKLGFSPVVNVMDQIIVRINLHYLENKVYDEKKTDIKIKKIETDTKFIELIEKASRLVVKTTNQLFVIKNFVNKLVAQETPEARGYYRVKLEDVLKNFVKNCQDLQALNSDDTVNRVLSQYYGGKMEINPIYNLPNSLMEFLDKSRKLTGSKTLKRDDDASILEDIKKVQTRICEVVPK